MAEVNQRTGSGLVLTDTAKHGESGGAAYVRWPDHRDGVITRSTASMDELRRTAEVLDLARSHGLPVPRHELIVPLADGTTAIVQQRLRGQPARQIDPGHVDAMVQMNERFADLLVDRPDVPVPRLNLGLDDALLGGHSERARQLLHRIQQIGHGAPGELTGTDLLHTDYTLGNILYDEAGQISGVVDWNAGAARGDRRFALIKLRIDLTWDRSTYLKTPTQASYRIEQAALDRMDETLTAVVDPATARVYWGHWIVCAGRCHAVAESHRRRSDRHARPHARGSEQAAT